MKFIGIYISKVVKAVNAIDARAARAHETAPLNIYRKNLRIVE